MHNEIKEVREIIQDTIGLVHSAIKTACKNKPELQQFVLHWHEDTVMQSYKTLQHNLLQLQKHMEKHATKQI